MKMFFVFIVTIFCFFPLALNAQQYKESASGEAIIAYPDGTWRVFDASSAEDIALKNNSLNPNVAAAPATDSENIKSIAVEQLQKAADNEKSASVDYEKESENFLIADNNLKAAKAEKANKNELKSLDNILQEQKRKLKIAQKKRDQAVDLRKDVEKIVLLPAEKQKQGLAKLGLYKEIKKESKKDVVEKAKPKNEEKDKKELPQKTTASKNTTAPAPSPKNVTAPIPPQNFKIAFDGVDAFTGKNRKEVEKSLFFTHTDEALKTYVKDKGRDYIVGEAYLSRFGGYNYLNIYFNIASDNTQRQFGLLEKGSSLNIKLLNGEKIRLLNNRTDGGNSDPKNGCTIYKGQYQIDPEDEKVLAKELIDTIVVVWTTGFDEYEITETDFLINQIRSLKNNKKY